MASPGFRSHRKFTQLVRTLGLPVAHVLGLCEMMWSAAYETGNAFLGDAEDVEAAAGWTGEKGVLCKALLDCGKGTAGLIDPVEGQPGRYQVHDLDDHLPDYVRARIRMRRMRSERRKEAPEQPVAQQTRTVAQPSRNRYVTVTETPPPSRPSPPPSPSLSPTPPLLSPPTTPIPPSRPPFSCPATASPSAGPTAIDPSTCEFPVFPCIKSQENHANCWTLTADQIRRWAETYPAVDVPAACRKAHAWILANPKKMKTFGGMQKFLNLWLSKDQDRGPRSGPSPPVPGVARGGMSMRERAKQRAEEVMR